MDEKLTTGATVYKMRGGSPVWLLVKADRGSDWELPKGPVRRGESSVSSILRQMRDDIGLIMEVLEESGRVTVQVSKNGVRTSGRTIFYLGERISGLTVEPTCVQKWLPYAQARRSLRTERERKILRQAGGVLRQCTRRRSL